MKKWLTILIVPLLMIGITTAAHATIITILDDYDVTNDISDVVHIGDKNYSYLIQQEPIGISWSTSFTLAEEPVAGSPFSISIDQYGANPSRGFFNHIILNGSVLGILSYDSISHWYTESFFSSDSELLNFGSENTISIFSALSTEIGEDPDNYDDFEFTNIILDYNSNPAPVPEPSTIVLMGLGLVGLAGFGRKKFKK